MSLPVHHSRERNPGERGFAFGRAEAARVQATVSGYRKLFAAARDLGGAEVRALGEQVGTYLAPLYPALVEEIGGIARGSRQDEATLLAINARTEVLGASTAPECSLMAITPEASTESVCLLAQNWDWHPALAASRILWRLPVEAGDGWMVTLTEAGILGKIGFNSRRLACGLNFLASTEDGGVSGLPVHVLSRLVLGRCETVVDGLRLLLNAKVAASSCITLAAATATSGVAVSVELSPRGARAVPPPSNGQLVHTNHFLRRIPTLGASKACRGSSSPTSPAKRQYVSMRRTQIPGRIDERPSLPSSWTSPTSECGSVTERLAKRRSRSSRHRASARRSHRSQYLLPPRRSWFSDPHAMMCV
jgi:isopenicillin-N N-acyltransferase-like protein